MKNDLLIITFLCITAIGLIIIGDVHEELIILPIVPLFVCLYMFYNDDWHNDSGAVG